MLAYSNFIDEGSKTEAQMSREQTEETLGALVREKYGYERKLMSEQSLAAPDANKVSVLQNRIKGVEEELERVGEFREPRNLLSK